MPRSPRLAHKAPVVQVTSMQARAFPVVAGVNTALLSMNEEKKAVYLSVNVFSTKALITSPTGDGTTIYVLIRTFNSQSCIGPVPGIEPAISRSAVKSSADWANPAAEKKAQKMDLERP